MYFDTVFTAIAGYFAHMCTYRVTLWGFSIPIGSFYITAGLVAVIVFLYKSFND